MKPIFYSQNPKGGRKSGSGTTSWRRRAKHDLKSAKKHLNPFKGSSERGTSRTEGSRSAPSSLSKPSPSITSPSKKERKKRDKEKKRELKEELKEVKRRFRRQDMSTNSSSRVSTPNHSPSVGEFELARAPNGTRRQDSDPQNSQLTLPSFSSTDDREETYTPNDLIPDTSDSQKALHIPGAFPEDLATSMHTAPGGRPVQTSNRPMRAITNSPPADPGDVGPVSQRFLTNLQREEGRHRLGNMPIEKSPQILELQGDENDPDLDQTELAALFGGSQFDEEADNLQHPGDCESDDIVTSERSLGAYRGNDQTNNGRQTINRQTEHGQPNNRNQGLTKKQRKERNKQQNQQKNQRKFEQSSVANPGRNAMQIGYGTETQKLLEAPSPESTFVNDGGASGFVDTLDGSLGSVRDAVGNWIKPAISGSGTMLSKAGTGQGLNQLVRMPSNVMSRLHRTPSHENSWLSFCAGKLVSALSSLRSEDAESGISRKRCACGRDYACYCDSSAKGSLMGLSYDSKSSLGILLLISMCLGATAPDRINQLFRLGARGVTETTTYFLKDSVSKT